MAAKQRLMFSSSDASLLGVPHPLSGLQFDLLMAEYDPRPRNHHCDPALDTVRKSLLGLPTSAGGAHRRRIPHGSELHPPSTRKKRWRGLDGDSDVVEGDGATRPQTEPAGYVARCSRYELRAEDYEVPGAETSHTIPRSDPQSLQHAVSPSTAGIEEREPPINAYESEYASPEVSCHLKKQGWDEGHLPAEDSPTVDTILREKTEGLLGQDREEQETGTSFVMHDSCVCKAQDPTYYDGDGKDPDGVTARHIMADEQVKRTSGLACSAEGDKTGEPHVPAVSSPSSGGRETYNDEACPGTLCRKSIGESGSDWKPVVQVPSKRPHTSQRKVGPFRESSSSHAGDGQLKPPARFNAPRGSPTESFVKAISSSGRRQLGASHASPRHWQGK